VPGGTSGQCEGPPARSVGGRFTRKVTARRGRHRRAAAGRRGHDRLLAGPRPCVPHHHRAARGVLHTWYGPTPGTQQDPPATHEAMIWTAATWQLSTASPADSIHRRPL